MQTIFKGTSEYYKKHRPAYPSEIFEDVISKFHLDGSGRLLDVGCGPGTLSIPLSKYFQEVIALDIDPGMIAEGNILAEKESIKNIRWVNESAEGLDITIGSFKLITLGASFHWLDREKFSKLAFDILSENGGVFISWTGNSLWNKKRNEWEEKVLEIIKKYLGNERRAGNGLFQISSGKHQDILKRAGFKKLEFESYASAKQIVTTDDIIKSQYTTSYAAKILFGGRAADFEKELTDELLKLNPLNKFEEVHTAGAVFAWKS